MASIHASKFANLILLHMNTGTNQSKWSTVEDIAGAVVAKGDGISVWKMSASVLSIAKTIMKRLKGRGLVDRSGGKLYKISTKAITEGWNREDPLQLDVPARDDDDDAEPLDDAPKSKEVYGDDEDEAEEIATPPAGVHPIEAKEIIELRARVKTLEADCRDLHRELAESDNRLDQVEKLAASAAAIRTIKIERYDGKTFTLKNVVLPSYFQTMLDLAKVNEHILLVGPAGCGKTTAASLLAKTMGLKFGKIGGSGGLTETHLLGRYNPLEKEGKKYVPSEFVIRYEQGGIMLVDELDAADQNVLLSLNAALDDSGEFPVPNRMGKPLAIRAKQFCCIGTANTYGTGSNRMYAGRNQLDMSTLSRFQIGIIECDYDKNVEMSICSSYGADDELLNRIWEIRRKAQESILRRVVDTRFIAKAYKMKTTAEWSDDKIIGQLLQGWTRDERNKVGESSLSV